MAYRVRAPGLPDLRFFTDFGNRFARRQAGQPRRAQCAAGLTAFVGHHRHIEDIGQQLRPERAAGAAANQRTLFDLRTALFQYLQTVADAEAHPFQHRVAELGAQAGMGHAPEHAARVRIVVRCTFAGEIG